MKALILALTTTLALTSFAHADNQCAFGEETWELKDQLDSEDSGKLWYDGGMVSLDKPERIKGLTKFERSLILAVSSEEEGCEKQALLSFQAADGYLRYFQPNSDRRTFVMVASYPGDNEYGQVFEIAKDANGRERIVEVSALIGDSFFSECKVLKSEIK